MGVVQMYRSRGVSVNNIVPPPFHGMGDNFLLNCTIRNKDITPILLKHRGPYHVATTVYAHVSTPRFPTFTARSTASHLPGQSPLEGSMCA